MGNHTYDPTSKPVAPAKGQFTFFVAGGANVSTGSGRGVAIDAFDKDGDGAFAWVSPVR